MWLVARINKARIVLAAAAALFAAGCTASSDNPPAFDADRPYDRSGVNPPASRSAFYMKEPYDRLEAHFAGCSRQTGYTPESARSLGRYQIPPNEVQWRECAYNGVRSIIVPATKHPDLYTSLIDKDKTMTQQVVARKMTRAQRRGQLDVDIARIRERESAEMLQARPGATATRDTQLERQSMYAINNVMDALR